MPMYNLIEYSSNYSETTGSLWFYSKEETNFNGDLANTNNSKSLMYKAKLLENTSRWNIWNSENATTAVPLNCLSNFCRSPEMPLINYKVEPKLKWTKYCVLSASGADNDNNRDSNNIIFTIKDKKFCVPVITLSARDNQKQSKLLSKGYERSVY